jgi:hypothetical protein
MHEMGFVGNCCKGTEHVVTRSREKWFWWLAGQREVLSTDLWCVGGLQQRLRPAVSGARVMAALLLQAIRIDW